MRYGDDIEICDLQEFNESLNCVCVFFLIFADMLGIEIAPFSHN